jgi:ribosomal subunit interface protein
MQIQISTDHNVDGTEALSAYVSDEIKQALNRFNQQITRVEVHISDENSDKKGGEDCLKCVMEARIGGRQPVAVTKQSKTLNQAVIGAVHKLSRLIESTLGRTGDQRGHHTEPHTYGLDELEEDA